MKTSIADKFNRVKAIMLLSTVCFVHILVAQDGVDCVDALDLQYNVSGYQYTQPHVIADKACELRTFLKLKGVSGYTTSINDITPSYCYAQPSVGREPCMQYYEDGAASSQNNLTIIRDFLIDDTNTESVPEVATDYTVLISYPETITFDTLSDLTKNSIAERLNIMADTHSSGYNMAEVEIAVIDTLMVYFDLIYNGIKPISDFEGFKQIKIEDSNNHTKTNEIKISAESSTSSIKYYNLGGYKVGETFIHDEIMSPQAFQYLSLTSDWTFSIYISGKEELIGNDFYDFYDSYQNDDANVKIWMHYDFLEPETATRDTNFNKKVNQNQYAYFKFESNISEEEAEHEANREWDTVLNDYVPEIIDSTADLIAPGCDGSKEKFGLKCVFGSAEYAMSKLDPNNTFHPNPLVAQAAFAGGFIDGAIGLVVFLEMMYKAAGRISMGFSDYKNLIYECGLGAALFVLQVQTYQFAEDVFEKISSAFSSLLEYDTYKKIYDELSQKFKENFKESIANAAAYLVGQIIFEAVLSALTSGAYTSLRAIKGAAILKHAKKINTGPQGTVSPLNKCATQITLVKTSKGGIKAVVKKTGCFISDTPVLMANNPFKNVVPAIALAGMPLVAPIQNVQVDDMVKAYHHEEMYLTASNDADDIYVPGWQDYDYLNITPETWQVGKFVITEENGNVVEIEANRPKKWFEDYELKKNGDKAFIHIEEMGIADYAVLKEIIPTDIDTRDFTLNEKGKVDRPVITTYKRIANEIIDYTFSNGQVISCTPNHPFYSSDQQAYLPVGELTFGEVVQTSGDREVKFIGGKTRAKGEHVYNFEVWREHNYYVGAKDFILVHNSCPGVKKTLVLPNLFQNWINTLKTKINPRKNYPDGKFEKHVTGDDIQYEAIGGGEKIWADGIDLNRNALVDAKHNPGDFYTLESYLEKPFLYGDLNEEFRRYAKIVDSGSNPAAELIIKISNQKESSELLFKHLGLKYKVPTSVETIPWTP